MMHDLTEQNKHEKTEYSYSADDLSLLDSILVPHVVRPLLKILPYSIPANIITIFSNTCVFIAFLIARLSLKGTYKGWFFIPILLFIYLIGDAIDGEQARRTKTGSPLGEFLDHFLDTFVTGELILSVIFVYHFLNPFVIYLVIYFSYLTQNALFWEKYKKGRLHFARFSSTESIIGLGILITLGRFNWIRQALTVKIGAFAFFQNLFANHFTNLLNLSCIELCFVIFIVFAINNIIGALVRSEQVSLNFIIYIFVTLAACILYSFSNFNFHFISWYTFCLLNILYSSSLLIAIVTKQKDRLPDFILPAALLIAFIFQYKTPFFTICCYVYTNIFVVLRAGIFIIKNRIYWVWKNPVPQAAEIRISN